MPYVIVDLARDAAAFVEHGKPNLEILPVRELCIFRFERKRALSQFVATLPVLCASAFHLLCTKPKQERCNASADEHEPLGGAAGAAARD